LKNFGSVYYEHNTKKILLPDKLLFIGVTPRLLKFASLAIAPAESNSHRLDILIDDQMYPIPRSSESSAEGSWYSAQAGRGVGDKASRSLTRS
jgi:hypothetical protein